MVYNYNQTPVEERELLYDLRQAFVIITTEIKKEIVAAIFHTCRRVASVFLPEGCVRKSRRAGSTCCTIWGFSPMTVAT